MSAPTVIIGGGLIGLATAHALAERSEEVLLLEAEDGVGMDTSFANGGMLTPSLPEPWNGPGVFGHLVTSLLRPGAPMKLRVGAIPSLFTWGIGFIRHSGRRSYYAASEHNYRLAAYSLEQTRAITDRLELQFDYADRGTLCIFEDEAHLQDRQALCERLAPLGLVSRRLKAGEVMETEPTLAPSADRLAGGIWLPDDARGDAHQFCRELARVVTGAGGEIRTNTRVTGIEVDKGKVAAVVTANGRIAAQRVIVAAGSYSAALVRPLGIRLALKPAKGYSLTIDGDGLGSLPDVAIGDDATHTVVTSLGRRLRVAGTAEFAGFDKSLTPARVAALYRALEAVLPEIARRVNRDKAEAWTGLRPMSNDGMPFVGPTGIDGLYVNSGHGALGWTMAMGSGSLLADVIAGRDAAIDPGPYLPVRR